MKTLGLILLFTGTTLFLLASCSKETGTASIDPVPAELEATYDEVLEEVDAIVESAIVYFNEHGRTAAQQETDERIRCALKTHDYENNRIVIDFGEGCRGWGGRLRKGKIIITYSDRKFIPGSVWVTTFEDFTFNGINIEGTRTCTNIASGLEDNPAFNIRFDNGKLTWPDGTFTEREADHTRTWIRKENPLMDEIILTGTASGKSRNGMVYTMTIMNTLRYKRACWPSGIFIPVEGLKIFKREGLPDVIIDYGDGGCDALITVTVDGLSREFDQGSYGI